tara:strand:+ start:57971 stop:58777 length:807 start_codon:yes stop_codon:yes gene_type:complete
VLKKRVITALILIAIVIAALFYLPSIGFKIFTGFFILLAAWEWGHLIGCSSLWHKIGFCLAILLALFATNYAAPLWILGGSVVWWLVALGWMILYPKGADFWRQNQWLKYLLGFVMLLPAWYGVNYLHDRPQGPALVLLLLLIIWGADSGAYFAGRRWGKQKLAEKLSPKKTLQGVFGGLVTAFVLAAVCIYAAQLQLGQLPFVGILILFTVMLSIMGDLFESMLKRMQDVKDSGSLLPGHGGVLDRVDSLTAAAPGFALGVLFLAGF